MQTASIHIYEFGEFQIDTGRRLLRRLDGTPVPLTPTVFETLLYMVEHHGAVLDKERIMEAVWPDSIVEENNLAQAISKLRQVFGETPGSHSYIVTVPGRGYRFVAEVNKRNGNIVSRGPADSTTTPTSIQGPIEAGSHSRPASAAPESSPRDEPVQLADFGSCHRGNYCRWLGSLVFRPLSEFARRCAGTQLACPGRHCLISPCADH